MQDSTIFICKAYTWAMSILSAVFVSTLYFQLGVCTMVV